MGIVCGHALLLRVARATLLLMCFAYPMVMCAAVNKYDKHGSCDEIGIDVDDDTTCLVDLSVTGPIKVIVHGTKNDPFWQQVHAGMKQTADDMKIDLEMVLFDEEDPSLGDSTPTLAMVEEFKLYEGYVNGDGSSDSDSLPRLPAAMIVSLPGDSKVKEGIETLQKSDIPIFGINAIGSNDDDSSCGFLQGMVSMNETHAGVLAGDQIRDILGSKENNNADETSGIIGIYINHQSDVNALSERFDALSAATKGFVESWEMVQIDKTTTEKEYMTFFEGCKHTVIQLAGGSGTVDSVLTALVANGCNIEDDHIVGTFDTSTPLIYDAMTEGTVKFAISQQPYLQGSNAVLMAALYATTGQKLGSASAQNPSNVNTGPILITKENENFPTGEQQSCEIDGFPVCSPNGGTNIGSNSNSGCTCTDRSKISIAVITHEESSDFWDIVFSGISQAATDFGVSIQKNQFKQVIPRNARVHQHGEPTVSRLQHTFDINMACQSKDVVDGLIVSLPDAIMMDSLATCTSNDIPYLAMNAVAHFDDDNFEGNGNGLSSGSVLQYVGQKDYESGLEAGKRLIEAGVKQGWCLVHANFDTINERCRGMERAFSKAKSDGSKVDFAGIINVPSNGDVSLYKSTVEETIDEYNGKDDWNGIGVLSTGKCQIPALLSLVDDYPEMLAGTYDLDSSLYRNNEKTLPDQIVFGIDQNAYMEGYLSVASMVWKISTKEASTTTVLETGPNFIGRSDLSPEETQECRNKDIKFCGAEAPPSITTSAMVPQDQPYDERPLKLSGKCSLLGRKCNACEGDCDDDTDCGEGLVCFIRDSKTKGQSELPPGCSTNPFEWQAKDFCVDARLYQCKDEEWIDVSVGSFTMKRTCHYVKDDMRRCSEYGRFCRETCGYCRSQKNNDRITNY